jgi:hypothetical protein
MTVMEKTIRYSLDAGELTITNLALLELSGKQKSPAIFVKSAKTISRNRPPAGFGFLPSRSSF